MPRGFTHASPGISTNRRSQSLKVGVKVACALLLSLGWVSHPVWAEIAALQALSCSELDISVAGTTDWMAFGPATGNSSRFVKVLDHKLDGTGITRIPEISAGTEVLGPDSAGGAVLRWSGGARLAHGIQSAEATLTVRLSGGDSATFEFAGSADHDSLASIVMVRSARLRVVARQGDESRSIETTDAQNVIQVRFGGSVPVIIALSGIAGEPAVIGGFGATLSEFGYWWIRDSRLALLYVPLDEDELRRSIYRGDSPNYLQVAREFADTMLQYGRDRYGAVRSPLFSNILTREPEPKTTPYPLFAERTPAQERDARLRRERLEAAARFAGPFEGFDFNHLLNYPDGLGANGPHKVTLYGSDPFEDRELYVALIELTRITGEKRYLEAAEDAIRWWFRNTQGPAGLFPWGEHMGWDLLNDCPTYFAGPSQYLYRANLHEVKNFVPFLNYLAALPPAPGERQTPLERYALGIWETHFWDKEKAYFSRHGDYTGREVPDDLGAYPAHLAFYLRVWAAAYLETTSDELRAKLDTILNRVADMALSRTERWGFFPQTLAPDIEGADAGGLIPRQSLRLAHHAIYVARQLEKVNPNVSAKLRRFSAMHLGKQSDETTLRNLEWAEAIGDNGFLEGTRDTRLPTAGRPALAGSVFSEDYAAQILSFIRLYRENGQATNLRFARVYARLAYARFCDGSSPLPRAFAQGAPSRTPAGEPFPDFYFKGAKLMRAFAMLDEVLRAESRVKRR